MASVLRGVFGYCWLVLMVRVAGRRPGKQMSPPDFILVFFMGGVTLTPMVGNDRSLVNALSVILSIAATHYAIAWLKHRYPAFGRIVDGTPIVLLRKGVWEFETMQRMRILDADVMAAARDKGIESLEQIDYAVLERNGEISVVGNE